MFLLSRLDQVSRHFPRDVTVTREFLLDRGIPAGSVEALPHFSARLAIDPSFRRDVTSLVQVVIQREDEAVDYMDLLGILVVAAAGQGPLNASDEQEESVREMLRFLTQIRRPTGAMRPVYVGSRDVISGAVAGEAFIIEPLSLPVRAARDVAVRPVSSVPFSPMEKSIRSRWRGAAVWIVGGIVLAVALGSWWWMIDHKRHTVSQGTAALQMAPSPSLPASPSSAVNENHETVPTVAIRVRKAPAPVIRKPQAVARHLNGLLRPPIESPKIEQVAPARPVQSLDAGHSLPPVKLSPPASPAVAAENIPVPRPVNALTETAANKAPPVNAATATGPSVRRRLPKSVVINPGPPRTGSLNASAPGVVHPASIGMMASNLISDPAPEYPAAASQARVQGEVTVRALVDREGKVIDARVVSGPELLREASLEAVQHWRYRPYMQGGRPVEVATTAVLDFELP